MARAGSSIRSAKPPAEWKRLLKPEEIPKRWRKLLLQVPGYDAIATAGDCRFDPEAAQLALDFFPEILRHVEGDLADEPFELEPWQQAIVANLFGWFRIDELGRIVRRYGEVLIYVPRKNGKTPLAAGIALLVFFLDSEAGQQCFVAAEAREQAGKLFRQAKGMVLAEPELSNRCRIYGGTAQAGQAKSLVKVDDETSFLQIIAADADVAHGGNTSLAVVDELHAQPNRELIDVLTTSTASLNRKSPLVIYLTTADFMRPSICNEKYDYACKVRDGILANPGFLPVIYEATKEDPWDDEATWRKANPNLGISVSLDYLRKECQHAKDVPAFENTYRRLHLNQRTETANRAIPMDKWDAMYPDVGPPDRDAFALRWRQEALERYPGKQCFGALDLGGSSDLTALALLFREAREQDGASWTHYTLLPFFWVPKESARLRSLRDRVDYELWVKQGFVFGTEGNWTHYATVRKDINELGQKFGIRKLAIDRLFQGEETMQNLVDDGFMAFPFGQGFFSMAAPVKRFLELIGAGQLEHGCNPVLRWMAANAATKQDPAGNLKFDKEKSADKIDGIVAATMALGVAMQAPPVTGRYYEDHEVESA